MTDDREWLASAYLDDEVTPDERAIVDADPVLLAEVERLRAVRDGLAVTDPGPISRREEQIASALGAWDRLPASERLGSEHEAGAATPRGLPAPRRPAGRNRQRWLVGAAAALVLVVGAGVVLQQIDPTDTGDPIAQTAEDSAGEPPDDATDDESADAESADDESADGEGDDGATADRPSGESEPADPGEAEPAEDLTARDIELESRAIEVIEGEGGDDLTHSADTPDDGPPSDASTTDYPVLEDNQDLAAFAAVALDAPASAETAVDADIVDEELAALPTLPDCGALGIDVVVGPAFFRDQLVMVGVDRDIDFAIAYDPQACTVVESIPVGG